MRCPRCSHCDDKVVDSRSSPTGDSIRRRRECLACGHRFTTHERVELQLPVIVKRDERREPFCRQKLAVGLERACEKRPITADEQARVLDRIERKLAEMSLREVPSAVIGDAMMEELKNLDGVAYLRFASVYRSYQDIQEFLEEISKVGGPEMLRKASPTAAPGSSSLSEEEG